jgi:outer membrane protein assembly factor BamB
MAPVTMQASDSWPQFRGLASGHTEVRDLPLTWSETEHVKWKTPLPGEGWSSPVVANNQVWMTTAVDGGASLHALCCDLATGKLLMDIEVFTNSVVPPKHERNSYASPSPIIEGDRVYLSFGSMGTACLSTKDGHKLWENREFVVDHQNGPGGSPAIYQDKLLLAFDGRDQQYGIALNKLTGKLVWKTERSAAATKLQAVVPDLRKAYGTPVVFQIDGRPQVLTTGAERLYSYDPSTGQELWSVDYPGFSNAPLPVTDGRMLFVCTGFMKPEIWGIRIGDAHGDATASHVAWRQKVAVPDQSTPVVVGSRLYMVSSSGIASCLNTATGETLWKERLGNDFAASPLAAEGRIYFFDALGKTTVLAPGDTFQVLAQNSLPAGCMASPAVVGKALIVRTKSSLYRIEN